MSDHEVNENVPHGIRAEEVAQLFHEAYERLAPASRE